MTGLSSATLELIVLILWIGVVVLGFMYRRTRNNVWRYVQLAVAYIEAEAAKERDRAAVAEGKKIGE